MLATKRGEKTRGVANKRKGREEERAATMSAGQVEKMREKVGWKRKEGREGDSSRASMERGQKDEGDKREEVYWMKRGDAAGVES